MQQEESTIQELNLQVLAVTFESQSHARRYVEETGLPWSMLVDARRQLYQAYQIGTGSVWDVYGPQSWSAYFKIMARGRMPHRPTGDTQQLGGDVLIDPEGIVRIHHVGTGPADRPEIEELLSVVRG